MSGSTPLTLAVLISGRGSNMTAIADACQRGELPARIVSVIADRPQATGLALAQQHNLPTRCVSAADYPQRDDFDADLLARIRESGAELVILAGFMRILGARFVDSLRDRLLNIHPSLLPQYRGLHTHRRVLENGETRHGATVHYVTPELDGGPRILQGEIAVHADETENALSARVQAIEHIIYPRVLGWIASGRLHCSAGRPQLDGYPLQQPVLEKFDV